MSLFSWNPLAPKPYSSLWLWLRIKRRNQYAFYKYHNDRLIDDQPCMDTGHGCNDDWLDYRIANVEKYPKDGCIIRSVPVITDSNNYSIDSDGEMSDNSEISDSTQDIGNYEVSFINHRDVKIIQQDDDISIILIKRNETLKCFTITHGEMSITLIMGSLSINGFNLIQNQPIVVSTGFGFYNLRCDIKDYYKFTHSKTVKKILKNTILTKITIKKILRTLDAQEGEKEYTILILRRNSDLRLMMLKMIFNLNPLGTEDWFKIICGPGFSPINQWIYLFDHVIAKISSDLRISQKFPKMLFCGGQNSGKTSLLRYFHNIFLSEKISSKIYIVDCDPGQSEFTPPGVLSIVELDQPILGPPFTSCLKFHSNVLISSSVGGVNVANNPDLYIISFSYLWKTFITDGYKEAPILINMMGWTQEIGSRILVDLMRIVEPTHVFEIKFSPIESKRNYPFPCTPEVINTSKGWCAEIKDLHLRGFSQIEENVKELDFHYTQFITLERKKKKASQRNRMNIQYAYMCLMCELAFKPLYEFTGLAVSWSQVFIHIEHEFPMPKRIVISALHKAWVHLCIINDEPKEELNVLDYLEENFCVGSAIVRKIDVEQKLIYLLTPETENTVRQINCIVKPLQMIAPNEILPI